MYRRDFRKRGSAVFAVPLLTTASSPTVFGFQAGAPDRIGIATWSFRHLMAAGRSASAPAPERAVMTALDAPKFVGEELGLTHLEIIINHLDERRRRAVARHARGRSPRRRDIKVWQPGFAVSPH